MSKFLVVVDMQDDFTGDVPGTREAVAIVPNVVEKIKHFAGEVVFTRDTHASNYLETQEGKNLPVKHCIKGSQGWALNKEIEACRADAKVFDKVTFGSKDLAAYLTAENDAGAIEEIQLVGLCTDICVISNALLIKAFLPEVRIVVDSSCCAGVTPQSHNNALEAMKSCQIEII